MKYRQELKFEVSDAELEILRGRLLPLMKMDQNQVGDAYTIRSLYFDDLQDTCLKENQDGADNRHKYRIRIYNAQTDRIRLEKKSKLRGMTRKEGCKITEEACRLYMEGKTPAFSESASDLEKEFYCEMKMHGMFPKTIVEYDRTAFVEPRGNVRITFDRNIRGSVLPGEFLEEKIARIPLLPSGMHVLEVKYDEFLPGYLLRTMQVGTLRRTSFSKYSYSRMI